FLGALDRDTRQTRLEGGSVTPELSALVLGEERELLWLLILFQLTLDRLFQLVEHGADVVDLSLLAGLQGVGQKLESILRAGVDRLQDGGLSAIEAHPKGIEQRIVRPDGPCLVQPLLDTRDTFFA